MSIIGLVVEHNRASFWDTSSSKSNFWSRIPQGLEMNMCFEKYLSKTKKRDIHTKFDLHTHNCSQESATNLKSEICTILLLLRCSF